MIGAKAEVDFAPAIDQQDTYAEFRRKGYVILPRAIPPDLLARMHSAWHEYFAVFSACRPAARRMIMYLPFKQPFYDPRFVEHPRVLSIIDRALGRNCVCGYFASETPLPGAAAQPMHFDLQFFQPWRALNRPLGFANKLSGSLGYCYSIQVTVPLVDSREDNAPLEVVPSSNRFTRERPAPQRLLMPAGSILIRDLRVLHRGTPHEGTDPRPFLSLAYVRTWVPKWRQPEIPQDVYDALPERSRVLFRLARIGQPVPDPWTWAHV